MSLPERFLDKVAFCPTTGCWIWCGALRNKSYGNFHDGHKSVRAHRYAFEAVKGSIPAGMEIDHLCCLTFCVNPDHLEAVHHSENMLRLSRSVRKQFCPKGHEMTPENTAKRSSKSLAGFRCRECVNAYYRKHRLEKKNVATV